MKIPEVFVGKPEITAAEAETRLAAACGQVIRNLPEFTFRAQNYYSAGGRYPSRALGDYTDNDWAHGFFPGQVWLAYQRSGNETLKYAGLIHAEHFLQRVESGQGMDNHDLGFLYTPSCVAAYKLTGSKRARRAAILAADRLMERFQPVGGFFQAWGAMGAADDYRYIIDCLLNLPLLYWASAETGDPRYAERAAIHTETCADNSFRADGSTYHTVFMDPETGGFVRGRTCQGYADDSFWARGQSWAVYGFALAYRALKKPKYLERFRAAAEFFVSKLPEDLVPYWDMVFTDGDEPRDSSADAIAACGLLEASSFAPECASIARKILKSLADRCAAPSTDGGGLLLHGTYSKRSPFNTCAPEGVDECLTWGDYFYFEALSRMAGLEAFW
ncbi:MAG: glycoside hydrolase family 88 protein [Clostridiales bacterium]|nr:glycoside hydrolase family 88 protein [Clostridiales bacterium]